MISDQQRGFIPDKLSIMTSNILAQQTDDDFRRAAIGHDLKIDAGGRLSTFSREILGAADNDSATLSLRMSRANLMRSGSVMCDDSQLVPTTKSKKPMLEIGSKFSPDRTAGS